MVEELINKGVKEMKKRKRTGFYTVNSSRVSHFISTDKPRLCL